MSDGIHTPFINIDELHKNQQDKLRKRYEIYEKILIRCHNKIKNTANHPDNMGFCFFEIPRYVYGTPLFDSKSCIVYMVNSLVKNGLDVRYTHPNLLYISWLGKTNQHSELQENVYQRAAITNGPSTSSNTITFPSSSPSSTSSYSNSYSNSNSTQSPTSYLSSSYTPTYKPTTQKPTHQPNQNYKSISTNDPDTTKLKAIEEIDKKILNIIKK